MRILLSISHLHIGGAQTFVVELAKALSGKHKVYIYDHQLYESSSEDTLEENLPPEVGIIRLPRAGERLVRFLQRGCARIGHKPDIYRTAKKIHFRIILAMYRIDIVNTHLYHSDHDIADIMWRMRVPVVLTDQGDYNFVVEQGVASKGDVLRIMNRMDGIILTSERNDRNLEKYRQGRAIPLKTIHKGKEPGEGGQHDRTAREELGISGKAIVFGIVARGIPEKGWEEGIEAFERVRKRTEKHICLLLVGGGEYLDSLKTALSPEKKKGVYFLGYTRDPEYWIKAFDVGLLPTRFAGESRPYSVMEYLIQGKPAIATDVGGIREMATCEEGEAGAFISPGGNGEIDIAALAGAMERYLTEPALLEKHSLLAARAGENLTMKKCAEKHEKFFRHILREKRTE